MSASGSLASSPSKGAARRKLSPSSPCQSPRGRLRMTGDASAPPRTPSRVKGKKDNIVVAVRVRPPRTDRCVVLMNERTTAIVDPRPKPGAPVKDHTYTFDYSYWSFNPNHPAYASQEHIFHDLGGQIIANAFEGYNNCLLAYGQTGSGKTYSMMGHSGDVGIIPRIGQALFERADERRLADPNWSYLVEASYFEIYNEKVRDLLNPDPEGATLKVREHPTTGPYVENLVRVLVSNYSEAERLMEQGNKARTVRATAMNARSSRSHCMFSLILTMIRRGDTASNSPSKDTNEELSTPTKGSSNTRLPSSARGLKEKKTVSNIHLVDLAGSERAFKTGSRGLVLQEGVQINKSLATLAKVIQMLARGQHMHIPFRESYLTWILRENLGGNSKTIMLATVSPDACHYEESLSTLRYANQAKQIATHAVVNENIIARMAHDLAAQISTLKSRLIKSTIDTIEERTQAEAELEEAEVLLQQLNLTTEEKDRLTNLLKAEREKALQKLGLTLGDHGHMPRLINLNEDPLMNEALVYSFKQGVTTIGSSLEADVILPSESILAMHCTVEHRDEGAESGVSEVVIAPHGEALIRVNGKPIEGETFLCEGDRVVLGSHYIFRFSNPSAAHARKAMSQELECRRDWSFAVEELASAKAEELYLEKMQRLSSEEGCDSNDDSLYLESPFGAAVALRRGWDFNASDASFPASLTVDRVQELESEVDALKERITELETKEHHMYDVQETLARATEKKSHELEAKEEELARLQTFFDAQAQNISYTQKELERNAEENEELRRQLAKQAEAHSLLRSELEAKEVVERQNANNGMRIHQLEKALAEVSADLRKKEFELETIHEKMVLKCQLMEAEHTGNESRLAEEHARVMADIKDTLAHSQAENAVMWERLQEFGRARDDAIQSQNLDKILQELKHVQSQVSDIRDQGRINNAEVFQALQTAMLNQELGVEEGEGDTQEDAALTIPRPASGTELGKAMREMQKAWMSEVDRTVGEIDQEVSRVHKAMIENFGWDAENLDEKDHLILALQAEISITKQAVEDREQHIQSTNKLLQEEIDASKTLRQALDEKEMIVEEKERKIESTNMLLEEELAKSRTLRAALEMKQTEVDEKEQLIESTHNVLEEEIAAGKYLRQALDEKEKVQDEMYRAKTVIQNLQGLMKAKDEKIATLEANIKNGRSEAEDSSSGNSRETMQLMEDELRSVRTALEEEVRKRQKTEDELKQNVLGRAESNISNKADKDQLRYLEDELEATLVLLKEEKSMRAKAEEGLQEANAALTDSLERAESNLRNTQESEYLQAELELTRQALAEEREMRAKIDQELDTANAALADSLERAESNLRNAQELEYLRSELESTRLALATERELREKADEEVNAANAALTDSLERAESNLRNAQELEYLQDELESTRLTLATERELREKADEEVNEANAALTDSLERAESNLRNAQELEYLQGELESTRLALATERELREKADEEVNEARTALEKDTANREHLRAELNSLRLALAEERLKQANASPERRESNANEGELVHLGKELESTQLELRKERDNNEKFGGKIDQLSAALGRKTSELEVSRGLVQQLEGRLKRGNEIVARDSDTAQDFHTLRAQMQGSLVASAEVREDVRSLIAAVTSSLANPARSAETLQRLFTTANRAEMRAKILHESMNESQAYIAELEEKICKWAYQIHASHAQLEHEHLEAIANEMRNHSAIQDRPQNKTPITSPLKSPLQSPSNNGCGGRMTPQSSPMTKMGQRRLRELQDMGMDDAILLKHGVNGLSKKVQSPQSPFVKRNLQPGPQSPSNPLTRPRATPK